MKDYTDWLDRMPPFGVYVEINRETWDKPMVVRREELHPAMNAANLYWRFTGIAQEMLGSRRK